MFPFDSPSDALTLLIPAVFLLYAIFLLKLKPSDEEKSPPKVIPPIASESPAGSQALIEPSKVTNVRTINTQALLNSRTHRATQQLTKGNARNQQVEVKQPIELDEQARAKSKKKAFFLFGEQDFEGCHHKPGHLSTVPKNTPIPEECFGCPEILECMKYKTK